MPLPYAVSVIGAHWPLPTTGSHNHLWISITALLVAGLAAVAGPVASIWIAKRRIHAELVSANRQEWINRLRDNISAFLSNSRSVVEMYQTGDSSSRECRERVERARTQFEHARLMLNPNEDDHNELVKLMNRLFGELQQPPAPDDFANGRENIVDLSRQILKREWERVKQKK